jgi:hypothetical protein
MMGVVLWIIVILVGIGVAVVVIVLLAPIQVALDWGSSRKRFRLRYLCLEIGNDKSVDGTRVKLFGATIFHKISTVEKATKAQIAEEETTEKAEKVEKKRKKKLTMGDWWEVWREHSDTIKKWLKQMVLLIYRVIRALRIDCIKINAIIATPDPYWTSVIYGYAEAVGWGLRMIPRVEINLNPDFQTDRPKGDIQLAVTYRMYRLTWAVMRFLWAVPKWGSIRMIRKLTQSSRRAQEVRK